MLVYLSRQERHIGRGECHTFVRPSNGAGAVVAAQGARRLLLGDGAAPGARVSAAHAVLVC